MERLLLWVNLQNYCLALKVIFKPFLPTDSSQTILDIVRLVLDILWVNHAINILCTWNDFSFTRFTEISRAIASGHWYICIWPFGSTASFCGSPILLFSTVIKTHESRILSEKIYSSYNVQSYRTRIEWLRKRERRKLVLGSLSTRAFETRTATGREHFLDVLGPSCLPDFYTTHFLWRKDT